jgi:hypothetical protein
VDSFQLKFCLQFSTQHVVWLAVSYLKSINGDIAICFILFYKFEDENMTFYFSDENKDHIDEEENVGICSDNNNCKIPPRCKYPNVQRNIALYDCETNKPIG